MTMKMSTKGISGFILGLCLIISCCINAQAAEEILPYAYNNLKYGLIKNSSIAVTDTGFVRIMNTADALYIEECSDDLNVISRKKIDRELGYYGGFYSGADAYYFVFGQNNEEEDNDKEVVRVVKYSKDWRRLGAAKITGNSKEFGQQVRYPFDYGNVSMAEYGGVLYIVTGHEGYVDSLYGQGHQGFLMFAVDESTMTGSIKAADLWHSFSQHLAINDSGEIYVLEESDGDRMTKVTRYGVSGSSGTKIPVLEYGGTHTSAWAIATYASADAVALSDNNVLAVGTSIDQSRYDDEDYTKSYNIYLTVTPMNNFTQDATTLKWITNDNLTRGYRDVKLTRISNDRFLLMWEQYESEDSIAAEDDYDSMSAHVLHYEFLDGSGNVIGSEHKAAAAISECEPAIKNGKAVFYSSDGGCVAFYSIDTATGAFDKKLYKLAGEDARWDYADGVLTVSGIGELYADMGSTAFDAIKDKVKKLVVSDGITKINEKSFYGLTSLSEVSLGKDITEIGASAFGNCAFGEIRVPRGTKTIGEKAFYGNQKIRNVYIPATVQTIGKDILWTGYYWIGSGAKVVYASIYCEKNSKAYEYAETEGIDSYVPEVTLADKTSEYTGSAIEIEAASVSVTTGEVTYTYYTDEACANKTTVSDNGASGEGAAPVYSGIYYVKAVAAPDDVFSEIVSNTAKLEIKTNDKENKDKTTQNTDEVTDKKLEEGSSVTDDKTFDEYQVISVTGESGTVVYSGPADRKVKNAVIPDVITIDGKTFRVSSIADNAFKGCTGLKTVKISAGIESIGKNAFKGCKKLTTVKIGSGMKVIGESAFEGCKALKSVTIEKNVTKIGKKAFYKCKSLKKIKFKTQKLQSVGSKAFKKIGSNYKVTFKKKYRKKYMKLIKGKIG